MHNHLIKTVLITVLMNARAAIAQTAPPMMLHTPQVTSRLAPVGSAVRADAVDPRLSAPVGHRQPRLEDVNMRKTGEVDGQSAAVDRELTICRGC